MTVRLGFRQRLETMLRSGYCLERAILLCGSLSGGYAARDAVESASGGQIRITAISPMPGLPGAVACGLPSMSTGLGKLQ